MNEVGWWELDVVATKLGFSRRDHLAALVARLITKGIINAAEFSRVRGRIVGSRGQPRKLTFLAPSAVVTVSAHASTPEAAAFRNAALARLAEMPTNALPTPVEHDEVAALRKALHDLEFRFAQVAGKTGALAARLDDLETRGPKQLALPMRAEVDHVAAHAAFVAAFEKLQTAVNGPNPNKGLTSAEIIELAKIGHVAALELREAIRGLNGGSLPATAASLGKLLQRVCDANGALEGRWSHGHVRRWVVAARGVH